MMSVDVDCPCHLYQMAVLKLIIRNKSRTRVICFGFTSRTAHGKLEGFTFFVYDMRLETFRPSGFKLLA